MFAYVKFFLCLLAFKYHPLVALVGSFVMLFWFALAAYSDSPILRNVHIGSSIPDSIVKLVWEPANQKDLNLCFDDAIASIVFGITPAGDQFETNAF